MPLHAALGEVAHECKSILVSPVGNWSTQLHMQEAAQLLGENAHLWNGAELDAKEICVISE